MCGLDSTSSSRREGCIIPQVQAQTGAVQKSQPNIHSILNKLKFCSPFLFKGSAAYKVGKRIFFEAKDMGKIQYQIRVCM